MVIDVSEQLQNILKGEGEGEQPEVNVYTVLVPTTWLKKRDGVLQSKYREIGRRLKSRTDECAAEELVQKRRIQVHEPLESLLGKR